MSFEELNIWGQNLWLKAPFKKALGMTSKSMKVSALRVGRTIVIFPLIKDSDYKVMLNELDELERSLGQIIQNVRYEKERILSRVNI